MKVELAGCGIRHVDVYAGRGEPVKKLGRVLRKTERAKGCVKEEG